MLSRKGGIPRESTMAESHEAGIGTNHGAESQPSHGMKPTELGPRSRNREQHPSFDVPLRSASAKWGVGRAREEMGLNPRRSETDWAHR